VPVRKKRFLWLPWRSAPSLTSLQVQSGESATDGSSSSESGGVTAGTVEGEGAGAGAAGAGASPMGPAWTTGLWDPPWPRAPVLLPWDLRMMAFASSRFLMVRERRSAWTERKSMLARIWQARSQMMGIDSGEEAERTRAGMLPRRALRSSRLIRLASRPLAEAAMACSRVQGRMGMGARKAPGWREVKPGG
jgi:hypothetical protein